MYQIPDIKKELANRLNALGFFKNKMVFIRNINEEAFATIAFTSRYYNDRKAKKEYYYLGLDVGVSFLEVNKMLQKLTNSETMYYDNVVHKQIGYLMPSNRYKEWEFVKGEKTTTVFDNMIECLQDYAFPYFTQMSDVNRVFDILKSGEGILHIIRDRYLPIFCYLKGDKKTGLKVIEESIQRQLTPNKSEAPHIEGAVVEIFVGPGVGKVDPAYLIFAERFKNLPEPTQYNLLT